ncbi:MAG TPA: FTR1 family protein [Propionicimonas sp.]|nr:FTR1 family protein [Propionicimonas sp.]HQD97204.1 FTR1 family protein [Propionicimonas sp.]
MFLASLLIGLREGLEASLIVGILIAYVRKRGRDDVVPRIGWGVAIAIVGSLALGAILTFGAYGLSFQGQEIIGGLMSLVAVGMVTWMVFWMMRTGHRLKAELEGEAAEALALGSGWAIAWIAFISVGREGIETTLMLWGWAGQPEALLGALVGIGVAAGIGYLLYRGMVRINLGTFFAWTGAFLIIVAAGILAYGIHDLQEAAILPGPFSGHPITPTDLRTGEVLVGLTDGPYWLAAFPFGWAFDLSDSMDPSGLVATFLKGTVGFTPQMSWLEVTAWAIYLAEVMPRFLIRVHRNRVARMARLAAVATPAVADPVPAIAPVPADAALPATNGSSRPSLANAVPLRDAGLRRDDPAADLAIDERTSS